MCNLLKQAVVQGYPQPTCVLVVLCAHPKQIVEPVQPLLRMAYSVLTVEESYLPFPCFPASSSLLLRLFFGFLGVSPFILPIINVQTNILSFIPLGLNSTKADSETLSSHLVRIFRRMILSDGDWVVQRSVRELLFQHTTNKQTLPQLSIYETVDKSVEARLCQKIIPHDFNPEDFS